MCNFKSALVIKNHIVLEIHNSGGYLITAGENGENTDHVVYKPSIETLTCLKYEM